MEEIYDEYEHEAEIDVEIPVSLTIRVRVCVPHPDSAATVEDVQQWLSEDNAPLDKVLQEIADDGYVTELCPHGIHMDNMEKLEEAAEKAIKEGQYSYEVISI